MRFPGWRTAAAVAFAAAVAVPLTAGAASASPRHDLKPEFVTISISTDNPDGTVNAYGPVRGHDGTDNQATPNLDVFTFEHGTVNAGHKTTWAGHPRLNLQNCTVTYAETGTWKFLGGTGRYQHATGWGTYRLFQFTVLKRSHHHHHGCDTNPADAPKFSETQITASGVASNGHDG
jgi:hypothetical protein